MNPFSSFGSLAANINHSVTSKSLDVWWFEKQAMGEITKNRPHYARLSHSRVMQTKNKRNIEKLNTFFTQRVNVISTTCYLRQVNWSQNVAMLHTIVILGSSLEFKLISGLDTKELTQLGGEVTKWEISTKQYIFINVGLLRKIDLNNCVLVSFPWSSDIFVFENDAREAVETFCIQIQIWITLKKLQFLPNFCICQNVYSNGERGGGGSWQTVLSKISKLYFQVRIRTTCNCCSDFARNAFTEVASMRT